MWVQNRVNVIRHNVPPERWFYVSTKINPADIASRNTNPSKLVNNSLWWNEPNFLITEQLEIPNQDNFSTTEDTEKQNDVVVVGVVKEKIGEGIDEVIDRSKFGSLEKLLRVTCIVRRFVLNLKAKKKGSQGLQGSLSVTKIEKNEVLWLRYEQCLVVQGDTFEKVKHPLNLVYDEQFLLRSKTRYSKYHKLDTSRKLPLLLRSHSHVTNLVKRDVHEKVFHNGVNSTLNFLRNKYWLIRE